MLEWIIALLIAVATPCATEDAAGPCHWDAVERGNGEGTSFVTIPTHDASESVVIHFRDYGITARIGHNN